MGKSVKKAKRGRPPGTDKEPMNIYVKKDRAQGLNPILSVERRRGRIKVQCNDGDYLLTSSIVRRKHPDFITKSFENGFVLFTDTL